MNESRRIRAVLLTSLDDAFIARLISQFLRIEEIELADVIRWLPQRRSRATFRWNLRKHGWIYVPWRAGYLVVELAQVAWRATIGRLLYGPERTGNLESICDRHALRLHKIGKLHSQEGVELVRSLACDLLLVCGTPILRPAVFTLPAIGTLNLHQGEAPRYRGAPPGFWEMWNNEEKAGVTIHFIDEGVDTGDIVLQELVPILSGDSLEDLQARLSETALHLYPEAVRRVARGSCKRERQTGGGKQYFFPTLRQRGALRWRLFIRQRRWRGLLRRPARSVYYLLILFLHGLQKQLFRRHDGRLVVLYYHRVSDLCRDGMTIGVDDFERQIRLLTRRFEMLSLSGLSALLAAGSRLQRDACLITFDDGYEDNYTQALPILTRYAVPALFFVSTALIGEDTPFDHDRHLAPDFRFRNMSWEQLRECEREGVDVGVHSHTHRNMAGLSLEEAADEIETSLRLYREKMGHDAVVMSYPFGKEKDFTCELKEYVSARTGLSALFSAYGGVNRFPLDPYNILRINVGTGDVGLAFLHKLTGGWRELLPRKGGRHA